MINAREISVLLFKKTNVCVREMINAREISVLSFKRQMCVRERDDKCMRNECVIV